MVQAIPERTDPAQSSLTLNAVVEFTNSFDEVIPFALAAPDRGKVELMSTVPEPSSIALIVGGLALVGVWRRRRDLDLS